MVHGHGQEPRARTKEAGAMTQGVAPSEIVCADRGSSRGGSRRGGQARAPTNGVHGSRPSTSTPAGAAGSSASVGIWDEQGSALPTAAMDARPGPWRSTVLVEAAVSADRVDGDGVWRGEQRGAHALSARCDESNDGKEGAIEAYPISEPGTGRRESSSYKDFGSVDEATRAVGCGTYSSCGGGSSDARPHGPGDGWGWEAGQDVGAVLAGSGRPHGAEQRLSSWARAVESIMRCGSYPVSGLTALCFGPLVFCNLRLQHTRCRTHLRQRAFSWKMKRCVCHCVIRGNVPPPAQSRRWFWMR